MNPSRWSLSRRVRGALGTVLAVSAGAGAPVPAMAEGLSLERAWQEALERNVEYRLAAAQVARAQARSGEARSAQLPSLMLDTSYTRTTQPALVFGQLLSRADLLPEHLDPARLNDPAADTDFAGALALRAPLWNGGRSRRAIDAADLGAQAARASLEWARQVLRYRVAEAYARAMETEAAIRVAQQAVAAAEAHEKMARDLVETGLAVRSDLSRASARLAEARAAVAQAEAAAQIARGQLNILVGRRAEERIPLSTSLPELERGLSAGTHPQERPDLRAAAATAEAARLAWAAAQRARWPALEFQGRYESHGGNLFRSDAADWTARLALSWVLADSGATAARAAEARAAYEASALGETGARQRAELDRVAAEARVAAARTAQAQAEAAVAASEEALAVVRDRYREGLATITELVDAEVALDRARQASLAARVAHIRELYASRLAQGGL